MIEIKKVGRIEVITGCMFSGKTEELIRELRCFQIAKLQIIVFKPNMGAELEIISHDGEKFKAFPIKNPYNIMAFDSDVVGIDDGQFFGEELVEVVKKIAYNGKRVIIAGLDMDFRGEPFGPMPQIMAIADDVLKLHAVCAVCGQDATMTQRLINGKPAKYDDPVIIIGAEEKYEARCRDHHEVLY